MANGSSKHGDATADRIRDEARRRQQSFDDLLDDVDEREEITGQVHVHIEKPDSDRPPRGVWPVLRWLLLLVAAAIGTALAAYLNAGQHH